MRNLELIFKALADSNRTRIVNLLLYGESCVCKLQEILKESQPKISRHLAYLKNSGLVEDRRESARIFYRLKPLPNKFLKELFSSLRNAFQSTPELAEDLIRLKQKLGSKKVYFIQQVSFPDPGKLKAAKRFQKGISF